MASFYISRLEVLGQDMTPSILEFSNGFNIIHGASNTGKTCIFNCIDFAFGSSKDSPFPTNYGYTTVRLFLVTDNGDIVIEREVGKTKINVRSSNPAIETNNYSRNEFIKVLMRLIGITGNPQVVVGADYKPNNLSWRMFAHTFLIDENEVSQATPILLESEKIFQTRSASALLYLISALDFSQIPHIDKKMVEAKKKAVIEYLQKEINDLNEEQVKLDKDIKSKDQQSIHEIIQGLVDELSVVEQRIAQEVNNRKNTLSQIFAERDRLSENDLLIKRYTELRSQYVADIKRLQMIIDGETTMSQVPAPDKCPYCECDMPEQHHESYIESANGESERIARLLSDLSETESSINAERENSSEILKRLMRDRESIEHLIQTELKPKADKLKRTLDEYRSFIQLQNQFDVLGKIKVDKTRYLNHMMSLKAEKVDGYKPRNHFPQDFETVMTELLDRVLRECQYKGYADGLFTLETFDVIVNGMHKETQGQGYKGFLNVVQAIILREYLDRYGAFPTRLLLIDSPFMSLQQNDDDQDLPETMKTGLLQYLARTQGIGQTIIIENKIPRLDYESMGVKCQRFTGDMI